MLPRISAQYFLCSCSQLLPRVRLGILPPADSKECLHTASRGREWVVFYKWPLMKQMRLISRFKLYQVTCMALLLPSMTHGCYSGVISGKTLACAWAAGLGTTAVFCVLSVGFSRVVGELAYLAERDCLRVSTLTFMGGRRDHLFPVESVLPPNEHWAKRAWQRLKISGCSEVFVYSRHYGHVMDAPLMKRLLGTES